MYINELQMNNFCGYKNTKINFVDENRNIIYWTILYGPNGIGKSNFLSAISLLASASMLQSRFKFDRHNKTMFFAKNTFDIDYTPGVIGYKEFEKMLSLKGVFVSNDDLSDKKEVIIENNKEEGKSGIIKNELAVDCNPVSIIDADKPSNLYSFALDSRNKEEFLNFAEAVYGFECSIPDNARVSIKQRDKDGEAEIGRRAESSLMPEQEEEIEMCTDFILKKPNGVKVHFAQMSDGERKIAKMLQMLFNKHYGKSGILLVDNIEMHIYFKRHLLLVQKIEEYFPAHQIIATTHSPVLVTELDPAYLIDVEKYI